MIEPDLFLWWPATPIASREEKKRRTEEESHGGNRTGAEAESGREETLYSRSVLRVGGKITSVRPSFAEVPKAPATFCRQSDHWILGLRGHFVRSIWP